MNKIKLFQDNNTPIFYLEKYQNKYECIAIPKDFTTYQGCISLAKVDKDNYTCYIGLKNLMKSNYFGYCFQKIPYCIACYYENWEFLNFCLLCQDGYYIDYQTSHCFPCPRGCFNCIQTDSSNIVKPPSRQSVPTDSPTNFIHFEKISINPDQSYVSIKCTKCSDDYVLYLGQCIQACPNNCKKCIIQNYQLVCISCVTYKNSNYQVFEGKCIQCPQNCKLCYPRLKEEKESFNPYFNNVDLDYFSHKCVFPLTNTSYYDQSINQFINCENSLSECQKQLVIDIVILYYNFIFILNLENYPKQDLTYATFIY